MNAEPTLTPEKAEHVLAHLDIFLANTRALRSRLLAVAAVLNDLVPRYSDYHQTIYSLMAPIDGDPANDDLSLLERASGISEVKAILGAIHDAVSEPSEPYRGELSGFKPSDDDLTNLVQVVQRELRFRSRWRKARHA